MKKYFGTDGIRGVANEFPLVPTFLAQLAQAIGTQFNQGNHHHKVLIGKDTRLSGYMIESALAAGFVSVGMDVLLVGPLPTPAIAMLTRSMRADVGVMISASHNPYRDNGIKLFGPDGNKLSDKIESHIEKRILETQDFSVPPDQMGHMTRITDVFGRYVEYLKSTLSRDCRFEGLKIVVDCAHGAAYQIAPLLLSELGAKVIPIGVSPTGTNINDHCGATAPQNMCQAVLQHQADLGISLDGDADRCIMCDEKGNLIDGDQIIAYIATHMHQKKKLNKSTVVTTVMSNLGFEDYLTSQGITLVRTCVGDRYVSEEMIANDYNLGGEQSGHVILSDYATSGDGLLTALQVLAHFIHEKRPASQTLHLFNPYPQVLKNVQLESSLLEQQNVKTLLEKHRQEIQAQKGRLLVRPSGTESVIRIMAEGQDSQLIEGFVDTVIADLKKCV